MSNEEILLNRQTLKIKAELCEMNLNQGRQKLFSIMGIVLTPIHVKIEALEIKNKLVRKSNENEIDIINKLYEGKYYVNILDYTFSEITFAASVICERWAEHIWGLLIKEESKKKHAKLTLTSSAIKEQLLKANPKIFSSLKEIDELCKNYELSIEDFIIPAKFDELSIELESIAARLDTEIFFFRRKVFTELFVQKLDSKIHLYEKDGSNTLNVNNLELYNSWKFEQLTQIQSVQKYIKSPFTFNDLDQFFNFSSIQNFVPKNELRQDLVSETLFWIDGFSKAKERFIRATELFENKSDWIDCVNNLRLTLELLLKQLLKNNKSLENQLEEIGRYQKRLRIGKEIRNIFIQILDYFNKYQNNRVKHEVNVESEYEVEFLFGLTMIYIRMLVKPNEEQNGKY